MEQNTFTDAFHKYTNEKVKPGQGVNDHIMLKLLVSFLGERCEIKVKPKPVDIVVKVPLKTVVVD